MNFAPFASDVHCHAHKVNMAVKTLSELDVFHCIVQLMCLSHAYFAHSPKTYSEYKSFAQTIDTKGLKLLKNVTTRWLSLLSPMRWVLSEYRTILEKMHIDCINKKEKVWNLNFDIFYVVSYLEHCEQGSRRGVFTAVTNLVLI
jgi:hypothetical protein